MNSAFREDSSLSEQFPNARYAIQGQSEALITFVDDRAGHDRRYAIDATKTQDELGYTPIESFETGIIKTVKWYLSNRSWWLPLIDMS